MTIPTYLPSPSISGIYVGPLKFHFYGLMYVIGIALALTIARRRWKATGGDPNLIDNVAYWAVPAGIIGGRLYFVVTTPSQMPQHWWGPFTIWDGGMGIWGGVAAALLVGWWRLRRQGIPAGPVMDAIAPTLLFAQGIGRIGNYFNQELFGGPTKLPWALMISPAHRPPGYGQYSTFQPTFLYELIFDFAWGTFLIWLGKHRKIRAPGLFALYVVGYSGYRIFEESMRIDYSQHFLGLRLNMFVAAGLTLFGLIWFAFTQRRRADEDGHNTRDIKVRVSP